MFRIHLCTKLTKQSSIQWSIFDKINYFDCIAEGFMYYWVQFL
jgi:hypothetical protein